MDELELQAVEYIEKTYDFANSEIKELLIEAFIAGAVFALSPEDEEGEEPYSDKPGCMGGCGGCSDE